MIAQDRIGRDGRTFAMYKFRSMLKDRRQAQVEFIGPDRRRNHKSDGDPRHRPFGRVLRRSSLDELPQFWNVLRGDMSLVGPRPELASVAREQGLVAHPRHLVRPGLTGPFQISELRSTGDLRLGLSMDVDYVMSPGALVDLRLIAKTFTALLRRTGS